MAMDRWLEVRDGQVFLVSENDGAAHERPVEIIHVVDEDGPWSDVWYTGGGLIQVSRAEAEGWRRWLAAQKAD
jgi:hypothetical protein